MGAHRRSENSLIKLKLKRFGIRAALLKAIEEVNELLTELETLLLIWDNGGPEKERLTAQVVSNIAEEYADVTVSVFGKKKACVRRASS